MNASTAFGQKPRWWLSPVPGSRGISLHVVKLARKRGVKVLARPQPAGIDERYAAGGAARTGGR